MSGAETIRSGGVRRREILKAGAIVVGVGASGALSLFRAPAGAQDGVALAKSLEPGRLATWLTLDGEGRVTAYFGKTEVGMGVSTAIAQVVAEELDVAVEAVTVVLGDTALTPNQGGTSGSTGVRMGANPLRTAAAQLRAALVREAAARLGTAVEDLVTADGVVSVAGDAERRVGYGALAQSLDVEAVELTWNERVGNGMDVVGPAPVKARSDYKIVGASVKRSDIPGKVLAQTEFCGHVSRPGMLHARTLRPPVANAVPVRVDQSSVADIPGVRVVHRDRFLAVAAPREWDAVKAARALRVEWSETEAPFPDGGAIYDHIRAAPARASSFGEASPAAAEIAAVDAAIAGSARVVEAEYEVPFQSHARMAPSIAVADVRADGVTVWNDTQKPHYTRTGIALLLGRPEEDVRVVSMPGAGSYGRSDADEAALEAAFLSSELGAPVRAQWSREEGTAWDPKGPAGVFTARAGLDESGAVTGWRFGAKGFSGWDVYFNCANPGDALIGQQLGHAKTGTDNYGEPGESYGFPNRLLYWETVAPLQEIASPLRTAHLRAPQEFQVHFAHESFVDEAAAASGQDPIAFRLANLENERERHVLEEVRRASGWETRPSPAGARDGDVVTGRGVALATGYGTHVATVCEVEVDRRTGRVRATRVVVAHDCGLVVNPLGLRLTIEGNVVQSLSRTLLEEVAFDPERVTSVDWLTYPILEADLAPDVIEAVMVERPDAPPGGAGEPALVSVPAAIANAVFDATGVRLRRLPLTPERVKAALG